MTINLRASILAVGLGLALVSHGYAQKEAPAKPPAISKAVAKQVKSAQDAIKKENWPECVAVLKGTDVDQPRNLAKSVTVE
jgi:glucosamine 6-phosphate synthetase-like amidotransferase/phosphosugar isomerase protein